MRDQRAFATATNAFGPAEGMIACSWIDWAYMMVRVVIVSAADHAQTSIGFREVLLPGSASRFVPIGALEPNDPISCASADLPPS